MATVLKQKVHSGQTIYIKIAGKVIGRAQGLMVEGLSVRKVFMKLVL